MAFDETLKNVSFRCKKHKCRNCSKVFNAFCDIDETQSNDSFEFKKIKCSVCIKVFVR